MSLEEQIEYWMDSAEYDLTVVDHLFESGDYPWCLFVGHLVLEKALKAIYVKKKKGVASKISSDWVGNRNKINVIIKGTGKKMIKYLVFS